MSDRELLEFAAKAAGIEIFFDDDGDCYRDKASGNRNYWNPLQFDGDALRLAVKMDMGIEVMLSLNETRAGDGDQDSVTEKHNGDPYAATRRAIVRAAAEIGRTL